MQEKRNDLNKKEAINYQSFTVCPIIKGIHFSKQQITAKSTAKRFASGKQAFFFYTDKYLFS